MTGCLRIVIVEEDGLIAMDLADLLISMGHDVCAIASTEGDAEEAAARWQPDLMIVDSSLYNGNGVAAMLRIFEAGDMAHFYVTGNPSAVWELAPNAIVVTKPFTMRDLDRGMVRARHAAKRRPNPV